MAADGADAPGADPTAELSHLRQAEAAARRIAAAAIDRAERMGALAAALVGAQSAEDVISILAEHVQQAVDCQTFSLRNADLDQQVSHALSMRGNPLGYRDRFGAVRLDVPSARAEVARTKRPVFLSSAEQNRQRYGTDAVEHYERARIEALARLPMLVEGELIAILSVGYWTARDFDEQERLFLTTLADLAAQALARAWRTERLRTEARRHRLLSAAQAAITRRLDPAAQLQALARSVVPELADFSSVHVLEQPAVPGALPPLPVRTERVASEIVDGVTPAPLQKGLEWYEGDPITETIRHGRLLTERLETPQVPEWSTRTGTAATFRTGLNRVVLAPVLVGGHVVAVASFGMCHDRAPWSPEDLAIIEEIAGCAAVALEHGLSYQATRETALILQQALLSAPPTVAGLEIAGRYRPAGRDKIGGDWFDAFETTPGRVSLAVGDVVGHDINAAAAMGQLRAAMRMLALDDTLPPDAVLRRLAQANQTLHMTHFATAAFARLIRTPGGWDLHWALAGHPPPVLIDPHGIPHLLEHGNGVALVPGIDAPFDTAHRALPPGSTLLLYTDGLVERRGTSLATGLTALTHLAASLSREPLDDLCDQLLHEAPTSDDVALLAVRTEN